MIAHCAPPPHAMSVLGTAYHIRRQRHHRTLCQYRTSRMISVDAYAMSVPDIAYEIRRHIRHVSTRHRE
eukprot:2814726-Rhodomonas_salina.2